MSDSESNSGVEEMSSKKKRKYEQHFKEEWLSEAPFKGWLVKSNKGRSFAKCKLCNKDINVISGKDALLKHSKGKFHSTKCKNVSSQPSITCFTSEATAVSAEKQRKEQLISEGKNIRLLDSSLFLFFF